MRSSGTARRTLAGLAAVLVLTGAGVARAQMDVGPVRLDGYGEAGLRFLTENPSRSRDAKFEEYRDLSQGLYLDRIRLRVYRPDEKYSFEVDGGDWGLQTQEFRLLGERLGQWQVGFAWDQMRHLYSTTARTFETEVRDGVWTLPVPRPALASWNEAPRLDDVAVRWDTMRAFVRLTPTSTLSLLAEYTRIRKEGERPVGMAFGFPGGTFLQILEPIDQTIHDLRLRGTWAHETWQIQFGYTMSVFVEEARFLRADNPCVPRPVPAGPCPAVGASAQFGTLSLPPSNQAHTLNLAAGVNLPLRTRLNGSFSYSVRFQNEDFLEQTYSNSLPATTPAVQLPARSLDGNVHVAVGNLTLTSRPLPAPVTFTAKYRLYDHADYSHEPSFGGYILNDQSAVIAPSGPGAFPNIEPFRAVRESFRRQSADLGARWKPLDWVALSAGPSWEQWQRGSVREVPETNEFFARASVDLTPSEWFQARATYLPSFRRIDRYRTNARRQAQNNAPAVEVAATPFAPIQSYLLRKHDEADRDRQRADLTLEFQPIESLSITPALGYTSDDYLDPGFARGNALGLRDRTSWSAGIDVTWTPSDRLKVTAGYVHESSYRKMRSSLAPGAVNPAADWVSTMTDTVDTITGAVQTALIPDRLDLMLAGTYAYALGRVTARHPNLAEATGIFVSRDTLGQRWPSYEDALLRIDAALTYRLTKRLSTKLYYTYEQLDYTNWQTDTLNPFLPGVAAVYLGDSPKGYRAQIVGATLRYRFE